MVQDKNSEFPDGIQNSVNIYKPEKKYQMGRCRKSTKWVRLSNYKTKAQQLEFLKRVIYMPTAMMLLSVKKTKPGKNRDIVYIHFH